MHRRQSLRNIVIGDGKCKCDRINLGIKLLPYCRYIFNIDCRDIIKRLFNDRFLVLYSESGQ